MLQDHALQSLCNQTDLDFEWVVVNDGKDQATKHLLQQARLPFPTTTIDIDHPKDGFGLCIARNIGLEKAQGSFVCYLDDDNQLRPEFVTQMRGWFQQHPNAWACFPQQWRRRDVIRGQQVIKAGKPFISPQTGTTLNDLINQRALFDSNGFTHRRLGAPRWNPDYRVFCDYEYFLQCMPMGEIEFNPTVLVDYVQTSEGVIGRSSYRQWAQELQRLYDCRYGYDGMAKGWADWMTRAIQRYQDKADRQIPGFRRHDDG